MSDIKFRGKQVDNGEWAYGHYLKHDNYSYIVTNIPKIPGMGTLAFLGQGCLIEVIPETVGRYTGLKDENDIEIYEGHIVLAANDTIQEIIFGEYKNDDCQSKHPCDGIGFFFKCEFGITIFGSPYEGCCYKIIGNIHENSKLLEVKQ